MQSYFLDGVKHITDPGGYDHMLFLVALSAPFSFREWKQILLLATAFTVGHSITLALAAFDLIRFPSNLIELLIPTTILITCISTIVRAKHETPKIYPIHFIIAVCFGLIHGMGFSSYFRMIYNETSSMVKGLLAFNLGVEAGQILIIAALLMLSSFLLLFVKKKRSLVIAVSLFAGFVATYLIADKLFA